MEGEKDKLLVGLGGAPDEGESLFSAFKQRPAPAAVPEPPRPAPAQQAPQPTPLNPPMPPEIQPARDTHNLEDRLAGMELKLEAAALRKPAPPSQDREMLEYLKTKINEMESKLREAQEKGLSFAYEVKGREESRREMEEFLAEVKRQQSESEAQRARGLELEKARVRIEALELKILEVSAQRPEPPPPPKPEITPEELDKIMAGLKERLASGLDAMGRSLGDKLARDNFEQLASGFNALSGDLAEKVAKENEARLAAGLEALGSRLAEKTAKATAEQLAARFEEIGRGLAEKISKVSADQFAALFEELGRGLVEKAVKGALEPLAARLAAENSLREVDMREICCLSQGMTSKAAAVEEAFSKKLAELETMFSGFSAPMNEAVAAAGRENKELRALAGTSFERISRLEAAMKGEFEQMASANEKFCAAVREMSVNMEASRKETSAMAEGLKQALQAGGGEAADAAARRLAQASGPYNLGFITACFDNLEKAFCSASDTLARAGAEARQAACEPGAAPALIAARQGAVIEAAARDLASAVAVFKGVRKEALGPIKKILGG